MSINKVINDGYCIGCGACAYKRNDVHMAWNKYGMLQPIGSIDDLDDNICPFSTTDNESAIADSLFSNTSNIKFDNKVGYHQTLLAGYVKDNNYRDNASSGGITSWLLVQLMSKKLIDGVIHVGKSDKTDELFSYSISHTLDDIKNKTRSQYYPTSFSDALTEVDVHKKYAIVGIPCYIKAVRLLCKKDASLKEAIKFFIGIFCGHLKTKAFAELLAWQQGIPPRKLKEINFRVKNSNGLASRYNIKVTSVDDDIKMEQTGHLYGTDWGLGLFKPKACEWCDDIAAETADVVFGDAWLPQYVSDPKGTNIVISRNNIITNILNSARKNGELVLDDISVDDVVRAQAGNYRHRQEGLMVRIEDADLKSIWHPKKREFLLQSTDDTTRRKIYITRNFISGESHKLFFAAKEKESLFFFFINMFRHDLKYRALTKNLVKNTIKMIYFCTNYLKKKWMK